MSIAIIPARGGSKRIPRKNIKLFCGKPMIAWSVEAALRSNLFEKVIVSTDSQEIAEIALHFGAEIPFIRPIELADDHSATRPVINHAISEIEPLYGRPEHICCIYPTAPFMATTDIRQAYNKLLAEQLDFVFTASTFPYPIQRAFREHPQGGVERLHPEYHLTRSQDLEEVYHDAGQFYWGRSEAFLNNIDMISSKSSAFILPRYRVHDIDTPEDWKRAEVMFDALHSNTNP